MSSCISRNINELPQKALECLLRKARGRSKVKPGNPQQHIVGERADYPRGRSGEMASGGLSWPVTLVLSWTSLSFQIHPLPCSLVPSGDQRKRRESCWGIYYMHMGQTGLVAALWLLTPGCCTILAGFPKPRLWLCGEFHKVPLLDPL